MTKSFHFVLNPISGPNRDPQKIRELIEIVFKEFDSYNYKIIETKYAGHAKEITRLCVENGVYCVVAIGGDGTVNEVASSLINTQVALGIIPAGSGNGFARNLNIPLNQESAIRHLCMAPNVNIDSGLMNDHFFIGVTGTGFDAHISECFSKVKRRGKLPYFRLALLEFFKYRFKIYSIEIDQKRLKINAFLVTVANSKEYGNGAIIAPKASSMDGFLDLSVIHKFPIYYIPILIKHLFSGTIHKSKYITYLKGKSITILGTGLMNAHIDGEPLKKLEKMNIKINPKSLYVIC